MPLGHRRLGALIFLFGLAISAAMVARSQVAGDQMNLLGLGWRFAFEGDWAAHGNPTSAGGFTPGSLTAAVIGAPLWIWQHHRSGALMILLSHALAYLLLDRLVRRTLGPQERLLFAVLYWLNPWRIYHSAFLWNPNYLFVIGAIHLWTAHRMRREPRFWATLCHLLALGLGVQVAIHTAPLALCTLLLWWRRYVRFHIGGVIAASVLVAASLVPWLFAVMADPGIFPAGEEGRWFFLLNTTLRAAIYWVRYASFALASELLMLDFSGWLGGAAQARLELPIEIVERALYLSSLAISLWANFRLWRGSGRWWLPADREQSEREWLVGVVRWSFVALLVIFAFSPATVSRWYVFSLFHLAVLPLVLAARWALADPSRQRVARPAAQAWGWISAALALALLLGGPMYRCGGKRSSGAASLPTLRHDHPMLDALGIQDSCRVTVNDPEGWWIQTVDPPALSEP